MFCDVHTISQERERLSVAGTTSEMASCSLRANPLA